MSDNSRRWVPEDIPAGDEILDALRAARWRCQRCKGEHDGSVLACPGCSRPVKAKR